MLCSTVGAKKDWKRQIEPVRLAVIDLGTNSVRFDVYEVGGGKPITRLHREKSMVRLGEGLYKDSNVLSRESIARTVRVFDEFNNWIKKWNVSHITAFGTSALRDAANSETVIQEVKKRTNIQIRIISGTEEAQLIAKGILNNETTPQGLYGLVDIGGGSTEISICHKKAVMGSHSFNLGATRIQQLFLKTIPPEKSKNGLDPIAQLREHIRSVMNPVIEKKNWPHVEIMIGSSGTLRAIQKMIKKANEKIQPFKKKSLESIVHQIEFLNRKELEKFPGMDPKRVDLILAGAVLLDEILNIFDTKKIFTTEYALRDGILESELERLIKGFPDSGT